MRKITVINAYGNKNIGDGAIQESALNFLTELVDQKDTLFLLSVEDYQYEKSPHFRAKIIQHQLPYGYAIQESSKPLSHINKIYRFIKIITSSIYYTALGKFNKKYISNKTSYAYIRAIMDADIVIGMGGGYFTSRYGVCDNFGLLLTLLPIYIAKQYHKKIIFLPLTFGPFASIVHSKITHKMLSGSIVFCRDNDSLEKINILNNKKYSVRAIYTPDLALFLNHVKNKNVENKKNYYVITAREWLEKNQQRLYEKQLGIVIQKNWDEKKLKAIFIPMAYNKIEDDDRRVANRIRRKLNNENMFSMTQARSSQEVQHVLQKAQFAICTRMHSAILSFAAETPFITIAYSPKINNFLNDFGLSEWNINIEEFNAKLLSEKINKLTEKENYDSFIRQIKIHKGRLNKQKQTFQFIFQAYMN